MTKFFVDGAGKYIGGFDGAKPPAGAIEIHEPPVDGRQILNTETGVWSPVAEIAPDSVTARQFKMQLVIGGLKAQVDAWIATQAEVIQVAYEYSGNFVKSEPMMQAGFTALGFTNEQLEEFFIAASKL